MRQASRMQTIGTETRVRGLRPRAGARGGGPGHHPPPDRRARFRHAGQRPRGGEAGARRRRDPLRAVRRHPGAARGDRRRRARPARASRSTPDQRVRHGRRQGRDALRDPRPDRPGRRGRSCRIPGYPIYESLTRFVGGTPVPIPIRMEHDFRLDVDELASLITPRTRMLVINSPANPTGGVLTRGDLERIAELAHAPRPGRARPTRSTAGSCTTAWSTSRSPRCPAWPSGRSSSTASRKTFAMTGWRLGYAIVPPSLVGMYGAADHQHDQRARRRSPRSARSRRCAGRRSGRRDGRGVPRAARPHRRRPERDPRRPLPPAEWRVLRVPRHLRDRAYRRRAGRAAAPGGGRLRPRRDRLRGRRRRPRPDLVRELAREPERALERIGDFVAKLPGVASAAGAAR